MEQEGKDKDEQKCWETMVKGRRLSFHSKSPVLRSTGSWEEMITVGIQSSELSPLTVTWGGW